MKRGFNIGVFLLKLRFSFFCEKNKGSINYIENGLMDSNKSWYYVASCFFQEFQEFFAWKITNWINSCANNLDSWIKSNTYFPHYMQSTFFLIVRLYKFISEISVSMQTVFRDVEKSIDSLFISAQRLIEWV